MTKLTHVQDSGDVSMVDVSEKSVTGREATARGVVRMTAETRAAILEHRVAKGAVLTTARLAGIMAAKRTAELIPLCHGVSLDHVEVRFAPTEDGLAVESTARCAARTGVEMEALVAVTHACLTVYDMAKAIDKGMVITDVQLIKKTGGKSGDWHTPNHTRAWPTEWI
ncbi:MAG: cyclic pyranopterin monophosphate synthase MoaC [bacterium]